MKLEARNDSVVKSACSAIVRTRVEPKHPNEKPAFPQMPAALTPPTPHPGQSGTETGKPLVFAGF